MKFLNEFFNYSCESEYKLVPDELNIASSSVAATLRVFMGECKISLKDFNLYHCLKQTNDTYLLKVCFKLDMSDFLDYNQQ